MLSACRHHMCVNVSPTSVRTTHTDTAAISSGLKHLKHDFVTLISKNNSPSLSAVLQLCPLPAEEDAKLWLVTMETTEAWEYIRLCKLLTRLIRPQIRRFLPQSDFINSPDHIGYSCHADRAENTQNIYIKRSLSLAQNEFMPEIKLIIDQIL